MGLLNTDQVIKELCKETGEPGFHNYTTIQGLMLDAIRDLNIFTMPCWSTATLPLSPFNTVEWPCDLIKPLITALKRNGCFYLLSVSDDLLSTQIPNLTQTTPLVEKQPEDLFQIDGFIEAYGWSVWSWGLGELYGAETMLPPFGLVMHDKKNRQSFIKNCRINTGDEIVMFFKSDGISDCPEFIPSEAKEQTEYFILQKYFRIRNPGLSDDMREKYKQENFRLRRFYMNGDEDTWTRAMNSNSVSTPKY